MREAVPDTSSQECRRILVVEDNSDLAFGLKLNFEIEGYHVLVEGDGAQALALPGVFCPDLIVLDLMLPGLDGFELLRRWRASDPLTRIIIISAKATEMDRITGLRLGADDYITKPFSIAELLERVKRQLQRLDRHDASERRIVCLGEARIDLAARTVTRNGVVNTFPPKEFALLSALLEANGAVLPKELILHKVWGHKAAVRTNTIEYHITRLRHKIEADPTTPKHIMTVSRIGYRLQL